MGPVVEGATAGRVAAAPTRPPQARGWTLFRWSGHRIRRGEELTVGLSLLVTLTLVALVAAPVFAERARTALVIGNADYRISPPLRNSVHDARDMAQALRAANFQVAFLTNASQRQMEAAIREFGQTLRRVRGDALFYYAGHGIEREGHNFLIPIGADVVELEDLKYKAVDVNQVLDQMQSARNGVNVVILDACRNNPYRSFRALGMRGLAAMTGPTGSIIAFATAPGGVAADGTARNGVFTRHLLRAMRQPGLGVEQVFQEVRRGVAKETGGEQIPWSNSSVIGQFHFTPPSKQTATTRQEPRIPEADSLVEQTPFELQPDGVLLDTRTGLLWYCPGDEREIHDHKEARKAAKRLRIPSGGDWRLPSEAELMHLLGGDQSPAGLFPGLQPDRYTRYWAKESNFWLGEGKVVGLAGGRVHSEKVAQSDVYRACFVRTP
jgi:hypothetical protein